jgi:triosephosphate isomerase
MVRAKKKSDDVELAAESKSGVSEELPIEVPSASVELQGEGKRRHGKDFTIVANWKMNKTIREALAYVQQLPKLLEGSMLPVWLAVPFTAIRSVRDALPSSYVVGAQNMNDATSGAFTGEIAAAMIKEAGGDFVLLGHSERRRYFHESDSFINQKVLRALQSELCPVVCIGEDYDQREGGRTEEVLKAQLEGGLQGVAPHQFSSCLIAYEPVWAIGTGKTATPDLVKETHLLIHSMLQALCGGSTGILPPILYGGSVSPATAEALATTEGVGGFLVGTASLEPESFAKIIRLSENVR